MENIEETSTAEGKQVSFFYKNDKGTDSIKLVFTLSKEGGAWKIDNIGGPESNEIKADVPSTTVPMLPQEPGATPPPLSSEKVEPETKTSSAVKTISGGMLNGKAISLPKPSYPPVARAAKASGTVVVQVTVDENGNVVQPRLFRTSVVAGSCGAARRSAKFHQPIIRQPVRYRSYP